MGFTSGRRKVKVKPLFIIILNQAGPLALPVFMKHGHLQIESKSIPAPSSLLMPTN
jgi:hypothetical protein